MIDFAQIVAHMLGATYEPKPWTGGTVRRVSGVVSRQE